ncbi:MAG: T9SS type A sorting domain-containing protein [Ignavibacteriae bacterium]|nr:T9SS type A sorting domain-containing protein [Ignavibacteriota bacterium]
MKTRKIIPAVLVIMFLSSFLQNANAQFPISQKTFDPNNALTHFSNWGCFNQNIGITNSPGYEWPKGSNKCAIFTTGLTIGALVNGSLRMAAVSYKGEYYPGYMNNGNPYTDTNFRIYKVKRGDNGNINPDYANWGAMVPYGAPYFDVNQNGVYDPGIDIPGVKNAEQTIFIYMTDGFIARHDSTEGFGGGTLPLNAEMSITAWGYHNVAIVEDFQFIKFRIINKNTSPWTHTFFGLVADPDLGYAQDDYIGCDTVRKLDYCYNSTNYDSTYGLNPPAVGFLLLKGMVNHSIIPNVNIGLSSFTYFTNTGSGPPPCESDPNGEQYPAYLMLKGVKKDSSLFKNPLTVPPAPTKFVYAGDPETNTGWTEYRGSIPNCSGNPNPAPILVNTAGDRRLIMGMGAENFTMAINDTQTIIIAQMIARGSSDLNSVTKLKALSDTVRNIYNNGFNLFYSISGNVKYQDNNQIVTSGSVKALRLDVNSGQIIVLDSAVIQPDGNYILNSVPQGDVYIGAVPNSTPPVDYVLTYHPSSIYWQNAVVLNPTSNLTDINVRVFRLSSVTTSNHISGKVNSASPVAPLKDANLYVKSGNTFVGFMTSGSNGTYIVNSLPSGSLKILADRIGYKRDSVMVNLIYGILDSVNFYLTKLFIGIKPISNFIPDNYLLYQNYPNPFNPTTRIKFQIKDSRFVNLKVYDILGKEIITLVNENLKAGQYEVTFNRANLPSGIYFYKLTAGDFTDVKRMVLIK